MEYDDIAAALQPSGLKLRGGLSPEDGSWCPGGGAPQPRTIILIGNYGPDLWMQFSEKRGTSVDPLDDWTKSVVRPIAAQFGAQAAFPSDRPYAPFVSWAMRAEAVQPSPLGILIHPEHGLWHAYRAALLFPHAVQFPEPADRPRPCDSCTEKPCLDACPVDAFAANRYDAGLCVTHLESAAQTCLETGCRARAACPVGETPYPTAQIRFHIGVFFARAPARSGSAITNRAQGHLPTSH